LTIQNGDHIVCYLTIENGDHIVCYLTIQNGDQLGFIFYFAIISFLF
jgi:hypothetical protein